MAETENVAFVRRFLEAFVCAHAGEIAGYFAEDAVRWNAPWQSVVGCEAIRETFERSCGSIRPASRSRKSPERP